MNMVKKLVCGVISAAVALGAASAWAAGTLPAGYEDENISTTDTSARRFDVDGKSVYVFTNAASALTVTAKRGIVLVDCLLVGGGGGGGHGRGGGGGGGGGVTNAVDIVGAYIDTDENFTVAVGAGGAGSVLTSSKGGNGGATSLEFGLFSATAAHTTPHASFLTIFIWILQLVFGYVNGKGSRL